MKLDLEYIKQILQIIEDSEIDSIKVVSVLDKFDLPSGMMYPGNDKYIDACKLKKHLSHLIELGFVSTSTSNDIFMTGNDGVGVMTNPKIALTVFGHQLLESLNDTIWNKIKSNFGTITKETLKQIPALALGVAGQMIINK